MAATRQNSSDTVKERKLRPIYELLDTGNNKKVIQEVDRILKKQSNFPCAKVLKGLAYLRMGKKDDCLSIITPIFEEVPTDENTIQALSICYRELDKPELVCQLLENACKKEKTEDLLTACFMAHVRVSDFNMQHRSAMTLYKHFPKTPYYTWAVMSLYCKALVDPPETANRLTLPLAEKMISKFLSEQDINTEPEVTLHVLILIQQRLFEKAFNIIDELSNAGVHWSPNAQANLMNKCLKTTDLAEKHFEHLEKMMVSNKNEWQYFFEYVNEFGVSRKERVASFLGSVSLVAEGREHNRNIVLSRLLHHKILKGKSLQSSQENFINVLNTHLTLFGTKPFYYYDASIFLKLLDLEKERCEFLQFADSLIKQDDGYKVENTQRFVNTAFLKHYFRIDEILTDPFKTMEYVGSLVQSYINYREQLLAKKIPLDPKDIYPQDDLLVLASQTLMDTFWMESPLWKGFYLANDMKRFGLKVDDRGSSSGTGSLKSAKENFDKEESQESGITNGITHLHVSEPKFNLPEEDFPVLLAMCILEYGLEASHSCSHLRILLGKAYTFCGAVVAGSDQFMRLDIKHAQIESLGYLYIWRTVLSGVLSDAYRVFNHADTFYSSHHKESMEHILSAYKYGSWEKILEFMNFRDGIMRSVQGNLLKVEKQLFEYTDAKTREMTSQLALKEKFDVKSAIFDINDRFEDNRDFRIVCQYRNKHVSSESVDVTFKDDVKRLKVRGTLLSLMDAFVTSIVELRDPTQFSSKIDYIESIFSLWEEQIGGDFKEFDYVEPSIDGPWSPIMYRYKSLGCLDVIQNFFKLLLTVAKQPNADNCHLVSSVELSILTMVQQQRTEWRGVKYLLINFSKLIESVFRVIETLGFCCVLADVLKCYLQKSGNTAEVGSKSKKKKTKEEHAVIDVPTTKGFNSLISCLSTCLKSVEDQIAEFKFASGFWYPSTWAELQGMWKGKASDEILTNVLPYCLPTVTDKINTSYYRAFNDMKTHASLKRKYVNSLLLTPVSQ